MGRFIPLFYSSYDPKYSRHCEYLMREKEAQLMARINKRPPLAWDGKKPLKFHWSLYLRGSVYLDSQIFAYDVEGQWFDTKQGRVTGAPFLVKRLD